MVLLRFCDFVHAWSEKVLPEFFFPVLSGISSYWKVFWPSNVLGFLRVFNGFYRCLKKQALLEVSDPAQADSLALQANAAVLFKAGWRGREMMMFNTPRATQCTDHGHRFLKNVCGVCTGFGFLPQGTVHSPPMT